MAAWTDGDPRPNLVTELEKLYPRLGRAITDIQISLDDSRFDENRDGEGAQRIRTDATTRIIELAGEMVGHALTITEADMQAKR